MKLINSRSSYSSVSFNCFFIFPFIFNQLCFVSFIIFGQNLFYGFFIINFTCWNCIIISQFIIEIGKIFFFVYT